MKRIIVLAGGLCLLVFGFVSCAEPAEPLIKDAVQASFEAWIKRYAPAAEKKPSGIYIQYLERGSGSSPRLKPDTSWLRMNYTLRTFDDLVMISRDSAMARLLGTWKSTTHFADDFLIYPSAKYNSSGKLCEGFRDAIQYLRQGDSMRVYIPVELGYIEELMSINNCFLGQQVGDGQTINNYRGKPIYFDIRLKDIVDDPTRVELTRVQDYARKKWGKLSRDSVAWGLYMRVLEDEPGSNKITTDSTVNFFYSIRFDDHQLVKTNSVQVAVKDDYYFYAMDAEWTFGINTFTPSNFSDIANNADTSSNRVFSKILLNTKMGQTVEAIAISSWTGEGSKGAEFNTPQILPFEPRCFQIKTIKGGASIKEGNYTLEHLM